MDTTVCPYCKSRVYLEEIEAEAGDCPECGASMVAGPTLFDDVSDFEEEEEDFGIDDDDDDDVSIDDDDDDDLDDF